MHEVCLGARDSDVPERVRRDGSRFEETGATLGRLSLYLSYSPFSLPLSLSLSLSLFLSLSFSRPLLYPSSLSLPRTLLLFLTHKTQRWMKWKEQGIHVWYLLTLYLCRWLAFTTRSISRPNKTGIEPSEPQGGRGFLADPLLAAILAFINEKEVADLSSNSSSKPHSE